MKSSDIPSELGARRKDPLKRLLRLILRRRWILIGGVVAGAVLGDLATLLAARQYTSTAQLEISRDTTQVVNVGALSRDVPTGDQEFYQTQYGLLRTEALAERVARDVGAVDDPAFFRMFGKSRAFEQTSGPAGHAQRNEIAGQILLHRVLLAPLHGSSLVDVQATTPSATLSTKVAQTWAEDFIASNLERRVSASSYARRFLESRIDQLRDKLERSERQAVDYAAANGIIDLPGANASRPSNNDPTQGRSLVTDDLVASNAAREAATAERIQADSRLAAASEQPDASSDALNYRAIGQLRKARADAAAEYAGLVAEHAPDDPAAKAARAQVDALDAAIQNERNRVRTSLQQTYQAASTREQALTRQVGALKGSLADQRQRSIQYRIYQRDAETNRELYYALLQRYKEIGVAGAAENNNVAVVDAARLPREPSSPRLLLNLILFTLAGAIAAAAAVAILQQVRGGVAEPDDFEEAFGLPLLGVAPNLKVQAPLDALNNPRSGFAETFLVTAANLELAAPGGASRSLAVTSARSREGVSTTAIALAQTLARAGRTVVLVDANLRSPSIHSAFGLANTAGLGDLLAGKAGIEAVLRTTRFEALSVITAGAQPANPADLLIGPALTPLVKGLQDRFDHVILDCPPVMDLADAPLIASTADGVICVVRATSTPAAKVRAALDRLRHARVLGGVLNRHEASRAGLGS